MNTQYTHRRRILLLIVLIVALGLLAAITQPYLVAFALGLGSGWILSLISIVWLLTH